MARSGLPLLAALLVALFAATASAAVLVVDSTGQTPGSYATLQEAVDAASSGDKIEVVGYENQWGAFIDKFLTFQFQNNPRVILHLADSKTEIKIFNSTFSYLQVYGGKTYLNDCNITDKLQPIRAADFMIERSKISQINLHRAGKVEVMASFIQLLLGPSFIFHLKSSVVQYSFGELSGEIDTSIVLGDRFTVNKSNVVRSYLQGVDILDFYEFDHLKYCHVISELQPDDFLT